MQLAADNRSAISALGIADGSASRRRRANRPAPSASNRSFDPGGASRNPELINTNAGKKEITTATPINVFWP